MDLNTPRKTVIVQGDSQSSFGVRTDDDCDVPHIPPLDEDDCCDYDLASGHHVAVAPLQRKFNDIVLGDRRRNHVMNDLVANGASTLSEGLSVKRKFLQKSITCCNFYCSSREEPSQDESHHTQPIPIQRPVDRVLQRKKLFPSFSHPDTSYIFTDEELLPILGRSPIGASGPSSSAASPILSSRRNWRRRSPDLELTWPLNTKDKKRISVLKASCSDNSFKCVTRDQGTDNYTIIPVHPEISVRVRNDPEREGANESSQSSVCPLKIETSESTGEQGPSSGPKVQPGLAEGQTNNDGNNRTCLDERDESEVLVAAQKFFLESGILGPLAMGNSLFRKSSKVHIIDNLQFEQVNNSK